MDFLQNNPLYVVAIIAVIIWFGLFLFMLSVSRRVQKMETHVRSTVPSKRV